MVQIHHALGLQALIALRRMGAAVDRRLIADKLAHAVQRLARGGQIVEYHGELVFIQRLVHIGDVAVEHEEQSVALHDDDAVAVGVALGLDEIDAFQDLLALREVIIGAIGERHRDNILNALQLGGGQLIGIDVDLRMGEGAQLAGVVAVPVSQQDLRHLLRLVAQSGKCLHVAADVPAGEAKAGFVRLFLRCTGGQAGVHQNHLVAGVDEIVLQAAAIADIVVEFLLSFFPSEGKGLGVEPVFSEFDCLDDHCFSSIPGNALFKRSSCCPVSLCQS